MIFAALFTPSRVAAPIAEPLRLDVMAVHEAHADFVWRSLQRLGVRGADLEDVFQEVFVVVHKRLHTFDGSSALTTWLFGVCLRVAAAQRRRAWFRREVPSDDVAEASEAGGERPDEAMELGERRALVGRVLDGMDLDKRAVLVMAEIDELESEEIATILGVPVGTVWSRLHAAKKQFQKVLAREKARAGGAP